MATLRDVDSYQSVIDGLSSVAFAQVKALLQSLDNPNPIAFRDALLVTYPELMAPFLSAAGDVAAQWYAELRAAAGLVGTVSPFVAPRPAQGQLDGVVRYSLTPLFAPEKFIGSGILELLAGATQKLIANQGRDTISGSALQDPRRVGVARIPRPGCCAFCSMLASRGAVYSQSTGSFKAHNFCRCVALPVWGKDPLASSTRKQYEAIYSSALLESDSRSTTDVLAEIRKQQGVK